MAESQSRHNSGESASHEAPKFTEARFLVTYCQQCERDVLSAGELDDEGHVVDVCVHCDAPVDGQHPDARWLDADALTEHGYLIEGHDSPDERHGGRGCRGGSCGIQQPENSAE